MAAGLGQGTVKLGTQVRGFGACGKAGDSGGAGKRDCKAWESCAGLGAQAGSGGRAGKRDCEAGDLCAGLWGVREGWQQRGWGKGPQGWGAMHRAQGVGRPRQWWGWGKDRGAWNSCAGITAWVGGL